MRGTFKNAGEKCALCNKSVYAAERQVVANQPYHFLCAGVFMESQRKAPVHNLAEERNANRNDPHYQDREKNYGVAATNIAALGGADEKRARVAAAKLDPAWQGTGTKAGLEVFRIEKFKVVRVPVEEHGSFFSGDSYIVLNTYIKGRTREGGHVFGWDIHFWLGRETSQDEAGTAAYKTVELDDVLGGGPVQHREVQDHESHLFLSYFDGKGGMRILDGGVESGFRIVEPEAYKPRLLWLKGRKNVRVTQVPISADSLNSGDVFILDLGLELYQWQGSESGPTERMRAALLCRAIDEERAGKPKIHVIEESDKPHLDTACSNFWKLLGYDGKQTVKSGDGVAGDEAWEKDHTLKLFRLSDASGEMRFSLEAEGRNVTVDKLDSNDVFILDAGCEVIVWVGKGASVEERKTGIDHAKHYLRGAGRPGWLPVTRVLDGGENEVFKSFFTHH